MGQPLCSRTSGAACASSTRRATSCALVVVRVRIGAGASRTSRSLSLKRFRTRHPGIATAFVFICICSHYGCNRVYALKRVEAAMNCLRVGHLRTTYVLVVALFTGLFSSQNSCRMRQLSLPCLTVKFSFTHLLTHSLTHSHHTHTHTHKHTDTETHTPLRATLSAEPTTQRLHRRCALHAALFSDFIGRL